METILVVKYWFKSAKSLVDRQAGDIVAGGEGDVRGHSRRVDKLGRVARMSAG